MAKPEKYFTKAALTVSEPAYAKLIGATGMKVAGKVAPIVAIFWEMWESVELDQRLAEIERAINAILEQIDELRREIARVELNFVSVNNRLKREQLEEIRTALVALADKIKLPDASPRDLAEHCIDARTLAGKFLAGAVPAIGINPEPHNFDLWRFSAIDDQNKPVHDVFGTLPTLCIYAGALTIWLGVRRRISAAGLGSSADDDIALRAHAEQLSARPIFSKLATRLNPSEAARPETLLEHALWFVSGAFRAASAGLECVLSESATNGMTGVSQRKEVVRTPIRPGERCNLDNFNITEDDVPSNLEEVETAAGIGWMRRFGDLLAAEVQSPAPSFPRSPAFSDTSLYILRPSGALELHQIAGVEQPIDRVTEDWRKPRKPTIGRVADDWSGYRKIIPGGQFALYGLQADGLLQWHWHDGHDSRSDRWRGPVEQRDFSAYFELFGSSDGVFYAVTGDGEVDWYRHRGVESGEPNTWAGPVRMPKVQRERQPAGQHGNFALRLPRLANWANAKKLFGVGSGHLYVLDADGSLVWHAHAGFLDGTPDLSDGIVVGRHWEKFVDVFSDRPGHIFALTQDRRIVGYRHHGSNDGQGVCDASGDEGLAALEHEQQETLRALFPQAAPAPKQLWEGPRVIARYEQDVKQVFALASIAPGVR